MHGTERGYICAVFWEGLSPVTLCKTDAPLQSKVMNIHTVRDSIWEFRINGSVAVAPAVHKELFKKIQSETCKDQLPLANTLW